MQENRISIQWTKKIFLEYNWSRKQLFDFLETLSELKFQENNLVSKRSFIHNLQLLIYRIERNGDLLQETKDMVEPGSIMESLGSDYKIIRSEYLRHRKQLKNQLAFINVVLK